MHAQDHNPMVNLGSVRSRRTLLGELLGGVCCLWAQTGAAQTAGRSSLPVVDVHTHLVGGSPQSRDFAAAIKTALGLMDRYAIQKTILMPPPQIDARLLYDYVDLAAALRGHFDRFAFLGGGGTLNPILHRYATASAIDDEIRRQFAAVARKILDAGAIGFGEMASLHISAMRGHPYEFAPADHPLLRLLADVAAERGVPIELHMDAVAGSMAPPARFAEGDNPPLLPETLTALERLLAHNAKAKIVWAHGGSDPIGAMTPATIDRLMQAHANLFVSLRIVPAAAPMRNRLLTSDGMDPAWRAVLLRHADRFMIGTDSFFVDAKRERGGPGFLFAQRNEPNLMAMRQALTLLPPEVAGKIASENALRVYRLAKR